MIPVNERPLMPQTYPATFAGLMSFTGDLVRQLIAVFQEYGYRLNRVLPVDGSERMRGPLPLAHYTVNTLPAASDHTGALVFVTDETDGPVAAFSDGTAWKRVTDGAPVA